MIHPLEALQRWIGDRLSRYLSQRTRTRSSSARTDHTLLMACLRPGDVLLIEGRTRISAPIKYLTQSIWSHAAIYVGDIPGLGRASTASKARPFTARSASRSDRSRPSSSARAPSAAMTRRAAR